MCFFQNEKLITSNLFFQALSQMSPTFNLHAIFFFFFIIIYMQFYFVAFILTTQIYYINGKKYSYSMKSIT